MRYRRQRKKFLVKPIKLEPRSKKAISDDDKLAFQHTILADLEGFRKRYFRAPVAVDFDFFPTENDPPAAYTMAKNYLDLLQHPIQELKTRRKRLLIEDDRQVRYLAVKYHIHQDRSEPNIWLKVAPYSNLVEDLSLLHKVQSGEIQENSGGRLPFHRDSVSWNELTKEEVSNTANDSALDNLREHERDKELWVAKFGHDIYEASRQMLLADVQNDLIESLALSPSDLLHLLAPSFLDLPLPSEDIYAVSRDNLLSPPLAIDLHHSDLEEGQSAVFKELVKQAITGFRKRLPLLFPLQVQVGVTILFQPPRDGGIDLDNLARRIIHFVNQELQPPSNLLLNFDLSKIGDNKMKSWFVEKRQHLKRMPKYSVRHYQVVQLSRLTNDLEHGFVRLKLEPGRHFSTLWTKIEGLADKWQEVVGCR